MKQIAIIFKEINGQYERVAKRKVKRNFVEYKGKKYPVSGGQLTYRKGNSLFYFIKQGAMGNLLLDKQGNGAVEMEMSKLTIDDVNRILKTKILNDLAREILGLDRLAKMAWMAMGGVMGALIMYIVLSSVW